MSPKKKSCERFEQNNFLARTVAKTLRTPSHIAAMWMFWTYAKPNGTFEMSAGLLGELIGIDRRSAQRVLTQMREDGVIEYAKGTASSGRANVFKITFKTPTEVRTVES